jgi:ribonuclease VapC
VVIDTSALLAVFFRERHAQWVATHLIENAAVLRMSTVNLVETLILIRDRQPTLAGAIEERLFTSGIRFVAPDVEQARIAAAARLRFPLNLGDCFAYALAVGEGCALLTVDHDFRTVDCPVLLPRS